MGNSVSKLGRKKASHSKDSLPNRGTRDYSSLPEGAYRGQPATYPFRFPDNPSYRAYQAQPRRRYRAPDPPQYSLASEPTSAVALKLSRETVRRSVSSLINAAQLQKDFHVYSSSFVKYLSYRWIESSGPSFELRLLGKIWAGTRVVYICDATERLWRREAETVGEFIYPASLINSEVVFKWEFVELLPPPSPIRRAERRR